MKDAKEKVQIVPYSNVIRNENFVSMQARNVKIRSLDNPGETSYVTIYQDPEKASIVQKNIALSQENAKLRAEIANHNAVPRLQGDGSYSLSKTGGDNLQIINMVVKYHENSPYDKYFCQIGRYHRKKFRKRMIDKQKVYLITCFLKEIFPNSSEDAIKMAYDRKGDASDNLTSAVRLLDSLLEAMQFAWQDEFPIVSAQQLDNYRATIEKIADCCGYKDGSYAKFFFFFTGDLMFAVRAFRNCYAFYTHDMERFQLVLCYIVNLFSDHPFLLDQDSADIFDLVENLKKDDVGNNEANLVLTFIKQAVDSVVTNITEPENNCSPVLTSEQEKILEFCAVIGNDGVSAKTMQEHFDMTSKSKFQKEILSPVVKQGYLEQTCLNRYSSKQKYRLTAAGMTVLQKIRPGVTFPNVCLTDPDNISSVSTQETPRS